MIEYRINNNNNTTTRRSIKDCSFRQSGLFPRRRHHHRQYSIAMLWRRPNKSIGWLVVVFLVAVLVFCANPIYADCNRLDRDSLLLFSGNVSSPSRPLNWSPAIDCCLWEGIDCAAAAAAAAGSDDRVTGLRLPNRGLEGAIHPSITNLTSLSVLNLSYNLLTGQIPDGFFTSLNQLEVIDLSNNRLSGTLPASDGLPAAVKTVNFSSNLLKGTIQSLFLRSVESLTAFNVSNNSFNGPIPSSVCAASPSVKFLDFSNNDFTGEIPAEFGDCSGLEVLRAGYNLLTGQIPSDIYKALELKELSLQANQLTGSIGDGIVKLTNLRTVQLFGNHLTGTIPREIGRLTELESLLLLVNNLTGTLPPSLMNCTNLKTLNLRVNRLTGDLSSLNFSKLTQINTLDLGNNNFTGTLPLSLFSCKSLKALRLASNNLVGQIVPEILGLQSLSFLSVSTNGFTNITGAIGILKGFKNLSTVIVSKNFLNEAMPGEESVVDNGGFSNLKVLGLGGCKFTGSVPAWLFKLGKLEVLDLSYNKITGTIPGWLGTLPNLFYLDLSYNLLWGGFPKELTQIPRLSSEQGEIDRGYLELPVFVNPNNVSFLQYYQLSNLPPSIYLDNNSLSGNIPTEIGRLKMIQILSLSLNNFSGTIPEDISNLTNLEFLNLAENNLTGVIPLSLKNLHFLSYFNVANNSLHGSIPTGSQFDTFPSSNFEGNEGLCGLALHKSCSVIPDTKQPSSTSRGSKSPKRKIMIGLILGICFGVGVTLTMMAFWSLSKRRVLPRGDSEKVDLDTMSFNSNSGLSMDLSKDASIVVVFPSNTHEIKNLTIAEILKATDNFNQANIIGCGGFGLVYKAVLENGTKVAVKKLSGDMGLMEREFKAEVEALSTAQHKNLVSLQGYCVHNGFRLLIYSYMENGSLDYWLHEKDDGPAQLEWPTRLRILQGSSCGLAYMHKICEPHIVHRDIKSSNILLDENFEAHVADFGLSRLILPYQTHVTTELVGTLGYIPPEYGQAWIATLRGDMYSFGVVMLELLTGKRPMEVFKPKMSRELVVWVQQKRSEGKQEEVFDALLRGKGFDEEMLKVLDVACMCVNENPLKRPTITEVVDWLHKVGADR